MRRAFATVLLTAVAASAGAQAPEGREGLDPRVVALIEESVVGVRAAPSSVDAWTRLCFAFEANLLWPEAADCYEQLVGLDPGTALWPHHKAVAHLEMGEIELARQQLERAIAVGPELLPALERLAYLELEQGDLEAADGRFERLVELAPERAAGHLGRGEVELQRGNSAEAVPHLEAAVRLDPLSGAAHYQLGLAYRGLGRTEEAERELNLGVGAERAYIPSPLAERITSYSVNTASLVDQAGALLQQGRNDEAVEILEGLVERSPEDVTLLNDLAIAYMRVDRHADAWTKLDRAQSLRPDDFSTQLNLSAWSSYTNRPADAVEYARAAVEIAPGVASTHLGLARALGDRKYLGIVEDPAAVRVEMLAEMARAIEIGVDSPDAYLQLARETWRDGDSERALGSLDSALQRWPDFWPGDLMRAWIFVRGDRLEEASEALERVRAAVPEHPDIAQLEQMIAAGAGGG